MGLSYEFSVGSVSAKEKQLFSSTDVEQMLACKSLDALCRFLVDKGYGDGDNVDEIIKDHTDRLWEYLKEITPDFEIFAPFIIQNDIHNLKVVLKGTMAGREYKSLLISPLSVDFDTLKEAVTHRKFSLLPQWLSQAADKAYELLAHTSDARLCDAVIDSAAMKQMLATSCSYSEFLKEYFETVVFYNNIKIAIRCARTGTTEDFLKKALVEVKDFDKSKTIAAALKGSEALIECLSKCSEYNCNRAIDEYKKSPSAFEKYVDNKLIIMAKESCKRKSEGAEPLLGYFLGNLAEASVIHIIASGIKTDADTDIIRERLREIYG